MANGLDLQLAAGDHVVHFYDDADAHVRTVGDHLASVMASGDSVVVVARSTRGDELTSRLAGVDIDEMRRDRRLVALDADALLAEFMVGSSPDPALFASVVGGLIGRVPALGPLHVYGEMVGMLWEAGNVAGAIELEDLWVQLLSEISFSLICGYECVRSFGPAEVDAFAEVCDRHSAVIGGAPVPSDADELRRFGCSTHALGAARRFVDQTLRDWDLDGVTADASLIVSELAANAVLHGGSDFAVGLSRHLGTVRIVVADASGTLPTLRSSAPETVGGRGLRVVAGLASSWGADLVPGGKLVWAELDPEPSGRP